MTLDPLLGTIQDIVYESLLELVGGSSNESAINGLEQIVASTVSKLEVDARAGTPWDIQVRTAPALFHRLCKKDGSGGRSIVLVSSLGLQRQIHSPLALARYLLPLVEDGCRIRNIAFDIQCHVKSAFLGITTPTRAEALRQAGRLPCPYCEQWCKGSKGVWWHVQQMHDTTAQNHADATAAAQAAQQVNVLALVVYDPTVGTTLCCSSTEGPNTSTVNENVSRILPDDPVEAIQRGDLRTLQRHVVSEYDPSSAIDNKGASPVSWAAGAGHVPILKYLIEECGCDASFRQRGRRAFQGRTPLHWAARKGHVDAVVYLVEQCRVDVNAVTADGTTAFGWAAWQGHTTVLQLLQQAGCQVASKNRFGCNAALWAAQGEGTVALLEWLERVGCPVTCVNENGHGVWHKAAQRGRRDVCEWFYRRISEECQKKSIIHKDWLLLLGPDADGCTPSDLAGMEGHEDLACWIAVQERTLVQAVARREDFCPPMWMTQAPHIVATMAMESIWEPWAGVARMRASTAFFQ